MITSQWQNKNVAFLGDSITDAVHVGTTKNYWQFLEEYLGIKALVYGINGNRWGHIPEQARKLQEEHASDVDAIVIFVGTNDYNFGYPLGEWFSFEETTVNQNGNMRSAVHRTPIMDENTFRGRINIALSYIKETFPQQQIILCTPIHRAFATFGPANIQPDENYSNPVGLFLEDYVADIRQAGTLWALPVIDLHSLSGLFPMTSSHRQFFHLADTDLLHPAVSGHQRIALTLMYQLLALPCFNAEC